MDKILKITDEMGIRLIENDGFASFVADFEMGGVSYSKNIDLDDARALIDDMSDAIDKVKLYIIDGR